MTALKDNILETAAFIQTLPQLPRRTWDRLVTEPMERARQKRIADRRALEEALERYYQTKNRFYDTLDSIMETTRVRRERAGVRGGGVMGRWLTSCRVLVTTGVDEGGEDDAEGGRRGAGPCEAHGDGRQGGGRCRGGECTAIRGGGQGHGREGETKGSHLILSIAEGEGSLTDRTPLRLSVHRWRISPPT